MYRYLSVLVCLVIGWGYFGTQALAQFPSVANTPATIVVEPRFPEPFTEVSLTLDAYTISTVGAEIVWFFDGIEATEVRNQRRVRFTTGDLGESTNVTVILRRNDGSTLAQTSETISPSRVDIIMEPLTTAPAGYRGAKLPSGGSTVRFVALPHGSSAANPTSYVYRWKLNGQTVNLGETVGSNVLTMQIPSGDAFVTVEVYDRNGRSVAANSLVIPQVSPEVHFYIDNPLRGQQEIAAGSVFDMTSEQITLRAEPYAFPELLPQEDVLIEWEVAGETVPTPSPDPFEISLERRGSNALTRVDFFLQHLEIARDFQKIYDSVVIRF